MSLSFPCLTIIIRPWESSNWGVFIKKPKPKYLYVEKILTNTYEGVYFLIKLRAPGKQFYWKRSASQVFFKDFCLSYNLSFSTFFKYRNNHFQRTPSVATSNHRSKQKNCVWVYIYRNKKVKDSTMYHPKLLKVYYTIFKKVYKFQQQLNAVEKVTGRRPTTLLKMRSFFFKNF